MISSSSRQASSNKHFIFYLPRNKYQLLEMLIFRRNTVQAQNISQRSLLGTNQRGVYFSLSSSSKGKSLARTLRESKTISLHSFPLWYKSTRFYFALGKKYKPSLTERILWHWCNPLRINQTYKFEKVVFQLISQANDPTTFVYFLEEGGTYTFGLVDC